MHQGVDDSYEVDQAASARGPVIRLTSEDPFAIFTQVTIQLNPQNIPLRIIAIDQVENELITQFHGGEFMRPGEDLFSFSQDRKSTRLNSSHVAISYAVFCFQTRH